ncbi:hypothetical protein L873DRAFT_1900896 [Choiromyces venosus 120613-1]|uniref:Uncharacterized protein n=1 Tax=Choiromyces venosus 120613-1 TaxID=1336337 RepID=A0A3N4JPR0_9PEZI|nr:hypothetical protein L873DRAFT_1900896 [Choiromyces venosus 120613-1]
MPMQVHMASSRDVAVLHSKEWFHLDDPDTEVLGKMLTFRLSSFIQFKDEEIFSSVGTLGQVLVGFPTKEVIQVASIQYITSPSHRNPYRATCQVQQAIPLNAKTELRIRAPASKEGDSRVSGDYNLIHVSQTISSYANLAGTITHRMFSSAAVRSLVETWAAENSARVRSFSSNFVGIVLLNDDIKTKLRHVGMVSDRKIIKVEATNKETQEKVLVGEAEVEQPVSAYIFTGQGSQEQGIGMGLYNSSPVAREVWDRVNLHFMDNYGSAITNIVRNNQKEFTVHFGGPHGKAIRQNYMPMTFESVAVDGSTTSQIFKDVTETTTSYTYCYPTGLLSAPQFTQPTLTVMC